MVRSCKGDQVPGACFETSSGRTAIDTGMLRDPMSVETLPSAADCPLLAAHRCTDACLLPDTPSRQSLDKPWMPQMHDAPAHVGPALPMPSNALPHSPLSPSRPMRPPVHIEIQARPLCLCSARGSWSASMHIGTSWRPPPYRPRNLPHSAPVRPPARCASSADLVPCGAKRL